MGGVAKASFGSVEPIEDVKLKKKKRKKQKTQAAITLQQQRHDALDAKFSAVSAQLQRVLETRPACIGVEDIPVG